MRISLGLAIGACTVALLAAVDSARATNGAWFLTLESAVGRSTLTYGTARHPFTLDSITVFRHSIASGRSFGDHMAGAVEVSWVQRGATDLVLTIFRPEGHGRSVSFERTYLDVGFPVSCRLRRARAFLAVGLSPRLSFLVGTKSSSLQAKYDKGPLVGVDPYITVGYRAVHVTTRYLFDLVQAHETSYSPSRLRIADKVFFIGLGCDIAL